MRQRAMIAMAITCNPDLLIADEPTTALDVTVQAQVLEVLLRIKDEIDSAIMLITHDLGVVAGIADNVMVMYAGRQVEFGTRQGDLLPHAPPVHARPAGVDPAPRLRRRREAGADPGRAAVADPPAARVLVQPALRLRPGPLPRRGAGAAPRRRRPTTSRRATSPRSWPTPTRPRVHDWSRAVTRRSRRHASTRRRRRRRRRAAVGARPGQGVPRPRRRVQPHRGQGAGGVGRVVRRACRTRRSGWSGSRAAASRRPAG